MSAVKAPSMLVAVLFTIAVCVLPIACLGQEAKGLNYVKLFERGLKECSEFRNPYAGIVRFIPGPSTDKDKYVFEPIHGLDDPNAVQFLIGVLENGPHWLPKEEHHFAKCYAAVSLGATHDSRALLPLIKAIKTIDENEKDEYIARFAVYGLSLLEDPNVVSLLIAVLDDKRGVVRRQAVRSLRDLGAFEAIKPLTEHLLNIKKPKLDSNSIERTDKKKAILAKRAENRYRQTVAHYGEAIAKIAKIKMEYKEMSDVQFWSDWWQKGSKFSKQRFDVTYSKWKNEKENNRPKYVVRTHFLKMIDLGIPVLPLMVEKVRLGETDFIPAISRLTDGKLKKDATQAECLDWWSKNKQKWLIPFGEKLRAGVEKL